MNTPAHTGILCLDHVTVPSGDRVAAARLLADVLGVAWAADGAIGAYSPVYVSDGLTLDFAQVEGPIARQHLCFRTAPPAFDAIVERMRTAGIPFRGTPHGPDDGQVAAVYGGHRVYWNVPDGHVWELLTVSYKRPPSVNRA
jgi:catechol 2,3-dioxygenase-like lactoylglutathione lyase family enzyme